MPRVRSWAVRFSGLSAYACDRSTWHLSVDGTASSGSAHLGPFARPPRDRDVTCSGLMPRAANPQHILSPACDHYAGETSRLLFSVRANVTGELHAREEASRCGLLRHTTCTATCPRSKLYWTKPSGRRRSDRRWRRCRALAAPASPERRPGRQRPELRALRRVRLHRRPALRLVRFLRLERCPGHEQRRVRLIRHQLRAGTVRQLQHLHARLRW